MERNKVEKNIGKKFLKKQTKLKERKKKKKSQTKSIFPETSLNYKKLIKINNP